MKMSVMFQQELPVYRSVDVVVVGAGPAGIGAAVAAARNGAKTLVFEAHGCIGGMGTSGMVTAASKRCSPRGFMGYRCSLPSQVRRVTELLSLHRKRMLTFPPAGMGPSGSR